jgi:hypothetical protein
MTISPITDSYDMYYGPARTGRSFENADSASPFFGEEHGSLKAGGPSQAEKKNLTGKGSGERKKGIEDPSEECQTCKNRKYKDGSDEMVSFKSPQHVSPENAASAVRAHEQEHVSNAYKKAAADDGKVVSASVSIHTAVCPECGRTYVSGGTTHTQIKYYNEENPYQQDLKSADRTKYVGMNLDYAI